MIPDPLSADGKNVMRQALAGMLWSKQYYHFVVRDWLEGDPGQPPPPEPRKAGRNSDWGHLRTAARVVQTHVVKYEPAESSSGLFGGNSNWRGPILLEQSGE